MKLISIEVLSEYGFEEKENLIPEALKVFTNGKMDILLKNDGLFYYQNLGFYYPLKDTAAFRNAIQRSQKRRS